MDEIPTDQTRTDHPEACPALEVLDRLVSDPNFKTVSGIEAHLESCEQCRRRLTEMRKADQFLERFRTNTYEDAPPTRPDEREVKIPGYKILGLIAFGGQGMVYRAFQHATEREVAIKVPLGNVLQRPSTRYRFEREIELTARLDHPGIVRVLGACELTDGRIGCVMEHVTGVAFDQWASAKRVQGRLRDIVLACEAVCDAIAYAHQRAVIHRDIKPSNVIVTDRDTPRVLDFGLAKAIDESDSSFATLTGAFLGTLVYSAPEQLSGGANAVDLRTDVYALGLMMFQALTGKLPYDSDVPPMDLVHQIREMPPTKPSAFAPAVGGELDAVVMKAMSKEAERRYPSVAEFRDDLRAWLDGRAVSAKKDSRWYIVRKAAWRHRRAAVLVGVLLVAMCTVLGAMVITRGQIARTKLANAVRDARTFESHWVRMAELRSIGKDNFEAGEFGAWDALLEPDQTLVLNGIEGPISNPSTPVSAAYWALWEIYLGTPVSHSLPSLERTATSYDLVHDAIVKNSRSHGELQWWDYRKGVVTRSIPTRAASPLAVLMLSPDARAAVLPHNEGTVFLLDTQTESLFQIDIEGQQRGARITNDRLLTITQFENDLFALRLRDTGSDPPSTISQHFINTPGPIALDASHTLAAVLSTNGDLAVLDMRTGELVLERSGDMQPRFLLVHSRGNTGEFLLYGPGSRVYTLDMNQSEGRIEPLGGKGTFVDGAREIVSAAESDRILAVTDRYHLELGLSSRDTTEPVLPALRATGVSLSADGNIAIGISLPSRRSIAIDLGTSAVRRLPFPVDVNEIGYATVTAVVFSEDSATLLAAGMDGSVRGYDTASGDARWIHQSDPDNGIEIMRLFGNTVYAGTQDHGRSNATVLRIRDGSTERLHPATERWFSGLEIDHSGRIWGLTGEGHLVLVDAESGALIRETRLRHHDEIPSVRALARLERHGLLIVGPAETGVVLLDEETLVPVGEVAMPPIREIAVSPTEPDLFATAGDDGRIRLWRFRPGSSPEAELVREMGTHAGAIFCIAFSPDGKRIASGGGAPEQRDVRIWDVEHGRELAAMGLFDLGVFGLAFSPDGRWLAACGEVHSKHPEQGGQVYLIDLQAPDRCIAGNLEYHIARFVDRHGREPERADALREWASRVR